MKKSMWLLSVLLGLILSILLNVGDAYSLATQNQRLAGHDRYATAARIVQEGWARSDFVILASGQGFADGMCAGPLAVKLSAPLLLTGPKKLEQETLSELKRLGAKHVIIIGGTGAVSSAVEDALKQAGIEETERIFGRDRFETSVKIAERLGSPKGAVLTSGHNPWDALTIGVIAAKEEMPILLTDQDDLSDSVGNYLKQQELAQIYVVGGTGAVSSELEKALANPLRIGGRNRIETNVLLMKEFENNLNFETVYAVHDGSVSESSFADALSITPLAAKGGYPIVLTSDKIPKELDDYLKTKISMTSKLIAIGGESAVSDNILLGFNEYILELLNGADHDSSDTGKAEPFPEEDTIPPSAIRITGQNRIPAGGAVTLTVEGGPLGDDSWGDILQIIKANTNAWGNWITGIEAEDLTMIPAPDGESAVLKNGNAGNAGIAADFIIPGEKVVDRAGNQAVGDIMIDSHLPVGVLSVSSGTEDGTYKLGDNIEIIVTFSDKVDITGTPSLHLETGTIDREAQYTGGSGTGRCVFRYTVQTGDVAADLDYTGTDALSLNGGTIRISDTLIDAALTLPSPGEEGSLGYNKEIEIHGLLAGGVVTKVKSSNLNNSYKAGTEIWITVTFNVDVTVTGTPVLRLETGVVDRDASYVGKGTAKELKFRYIVQAGDSSPDLDYCGADSLLLNGGTIKVTETSEHVDPTLPSPGMAGSLGQNSNIIIDTTAPSAIQISQQNSIPANGNVTLSAVDGPLTADSWGKILSRIKDNTISGPWIENISSTNLTMTTSIDGVTATLNNKSSSSATIISDFIIPAAEVIDRAGNTAAYEIRIDAYSGD